MYTKFDQTWLFLVSKLIGWTLTLLHINQFINYNKPPRANVKNIEVLCSVLMKETDFGTKYSCRLAVRFVPIEVEQHRTHLWTLRWWISQWESIVISAGQTCSLYWAQIYEWQWIMLQSRFCPCWVQCSQRSGHSVKNSNSQSWTENILQKITENI